MLTLQKLHESRHLIPVVLLIAAVVVVFGGRLFAATEQAVMYFRGSVYGLQAGSPVVFRGVRLGSVRSVGVVFAQGRFAVVASCRGRPDGRQPFDHHASVIGVSEGG